MGSVWEGECPKFWGGTEEVDKALSIARADLGAVWDANQVSVAVDPKATVEFLSGRDEQGLEDVSRLIIT